MSINLLSKSILIYYAAINILLFAVMGYDKHRAKKNLWRVSESMLFTIALLGGGIGGFIGMRAFRHKTKKPLFYIIFIFSVILHLAMLYFSVNFI